jgi:hypothetical protein
MQLPAAERGAEEEQAMAAEAAAAVVDIYGCELMRLIMVRKS